MTPTRPSMAPDLAALLQGFGQHSGGGYRPGAMPGMPQQPGLLDSLGGAGGLLAMSQMMKGRGDPTMTGYGGYGMNSLLDALKGYGLNSGYSGSMANGTAFSPMAGGGG